jgi:mono/diheme cytochrome c family protein
MSARLKEGAMKFLGVLAVLFIILSPSLHAQNLLDKSLSAQEKSGQKLFLQRCALCHVGYAPMYRTYGPAVDKEIVADRGEKAVRTKIMDGSVAMPGWKYSLKPADIDNIIAYLKTVKKEDIQAVDTSGTGSSEADK